MERANLARIEQIEAQVNAVFEIAEEEESLEDFYLTLMKATAPSAQPLLPKS